MTIQRYEALWAYRLTLPDPQERYQPLDADHAALAAWIAAGLRGFGPSNEINQAVQQAVRDRTAGDPPQLVRDHSRVALVAWSLGQVVGDYDRSLPVVFCEPLADRSVPTCRRVSGTRRRPTCSPGCHPSRSWTWCGHCRTAVMSSP